MYLAYNQTDNIQIKLHSNYIDLTIFIPFKPSKPSPSLHLSQTLPSLSLKILTRISDFTLTKLRLYPILSLKFSREFFTRLYPFRLSHHHFPRL